MEANGVATAPGLTAYPRPRPSDNRPFLTLVEEAYKTPNANLPPAAWEPVAYLASEMVSALDRIARMEIPQDLEWARDRTLANWDQMKNWIDGLLDVSPAIKALRSWQLVAAMQQAAEIPMRPSSTIVPQIHNPATSAQAEGQQPKKRFGLRR